MDRRVDKGLPPEGGRDARIPRADLVEELARQVGDRDRGDGADRMVHLAQNEDVEVADVARQEERNDLAATVLELLVAAGPAVQDQVDVLRFLAFSRNVRARRKRPDTLRGRAIEHQAVRCREADEILKFANQVAQYRFPRVANRGSRRCAFNNLC